MSENKIGLYLVCLTKYNWTYIFRLATIDEVAQQMCSLDSGRSRPQQEVRNPTHPAIPVQKLVSGIASRVMFKMERVELPSLSIGRASLNVFRSAEDMPLQGLIKIIDQEPKFKLNLMSMVDLQLSFGKLLDSFGWCSTKIPIITTQNSRHLNLQAATEETKNINKRMFWIEMEDLNKLSAYIFLSKLICEALPALCLLGKLVFTENGKQISSEVLKELIPLIEHLTRIEDWRHLSEISNIPVEGSMSLSSIIRGMSPSIDARLKTQIMSSLRLLCHWEDVANKTSFILSQMPATTLSDLQQNFQDGQTERDLQAKASISAVYVNEYCTIDVYIPTIIDLNSTNLVTCEEPAQDARMVRVAAWDKLIERLVLHTYSGGVKNDAVNFYEIQWEQQQQFLRIRPYLIRQTLLVDFNATLETIKKELSIEILGKNYTNTLYSNLTWKKDPAKTKKNELFEGGFKLFYRCGYPIPMQRNPIDAQVPVCLELQSSGRQWMVNDLAIQEHKSEITPGVRELFIDVNVSTEIQVKKLKAEIQGLDTRVIQHMFSTKHLLESLIVALNSKTNTNLATLNLSVDKLNLDHKSYAAAAGAAPGSSSAGLPGSSSAGLPVVAGLPVAAGLPDAVGPSSGLSTGSDTAVATDSFFGVVQPMEIVDESTDRNKNKHNKSKKK